MSRAASAIKQFYYAPSDMKLTEKKAFLLSIANDELFRSAYRLFDGVINTKVGRIVLWLVYRKFWRLALFISEHDPKVHGTSLSYVGK